MTERVSVNGREVWIEIEAHPAGRKNPNVIPTEYFTARYHLDETKQSEGKYITDNDNDEPKLFESPVAALRYANDRLMNML